MLTPVQCLCKGLFCSAYFYFNRLKDSNLTSNLSITFVWCSCLLPCFSLLAAAFLAFDYSWLLGRWRFDSLDFTSNFVWLQFLKRPVVLTSCPRDCPLGRLVSEGFNTYHRVLGSRIGVNHVASHYGWLANFNQMHKTSEDLLNVCVFQSLWEEWTKFGSGSQQLPVHRINYGIGYITLIGTE